MSLGRRIEERIKALHISQSELARRAGAPTSTINSLVRKPNIRSTPYLVKIASALQTTPAYLTGETDDPHSDSPIPPIINSDERELFENFANLAPADRRALLQIARSMAAGGAPPSETVHDSKRGYRGEK